MLLTMSIIGGGSIKLPKINVVLSGKLPTMGTLERSPLSKVMDLGDNRRKLEVTMTIIQAKKAGESKMPNDKQSKQYGLGKS